MNTQLFETDKAALAAGYARFNGNPHLAVDVPDGGFTITAKTSEGKRITFAFQPYKNGGPPQCVDIAYHDNGTSDSFCGNDLPTFDILAFGRTAERKPDGREPNNRYQLDTRKQPFKPGIVCVLMDDRDQEGNAK
jgi:hypothetical protein